MKKLLSLFTSTLIVQTLSITALRAEELPPETPSTLSADCFYVGAQSLDTTSIISGSAVGIDKALTESNGIITLKIRPGAQDPALTVWTARQTINIGFNYSIVLSLTFQNGERFASRVFKNEVLETRALLKYKNRVVSAASVSTNQITSQFINGMGKKFYLAAFKLDNTLLREKLGLVDQIDEDLTFPLRDSRQKMSLFSSLGDGTGAVTSATIHCKLPIQE